MNKLFKKSIMASLAVVTVTSYVGADGGGFGGGFAAGALTGIAVTSIASSANRERSPEYYEQKTVQQRNRTINNQIETHKREIKKHNRDIERINRKNNLDDVTKAQQIKPHRDIIQRLEAKIDELIHELE
ncbi:hypothetical protein KBD08_01730 [Candidatus Babeliales bacterium]|nr:hypothetical protein [Candidatus Babeliales bacterium]